MPTFNDETPLQRQQRDREVELAHYARMTPVEIERLVIDKHNAEAQRDAYKIIAVCTAGALESAGFTDIDNPADAIEIIVSQRDLILEALKFVLERIEIPDRDCSCHISPPCNDCVDNSGIREAVEFANNAIAKAES